MAFPKQEKIQILETDLAGVLFQIRSTINNNHRFGKARRDYSKSELDQLGIDESAYREILRP